MGGKKEWKCWSKTKRVVVAAFFQLFELVLFVAATTLRNLMSFSSINAVKVKKFELDTRLIGKAG